MAYVVVYDACVLYPAGLRDFLLRLALTHLFQAKWTDRIHDEWIGGVLRDRHDLADKLPRTRALMDQAVPDALVTDYEDLIDSLTLPDPDDRHVLAAAIRAGAQAIITFNLKDFPKAALDRYDIEAMDPDTFVEHQFYLGQDRVLRAAKGQRASLTNPSKTIEEFLDTLASVGLVKTASLLKPFGDFL